MTTTTTTTSPPWEDDPARLAEQAEEEKAAKAFGVSVEGLRRQRRGLGQLVTGPYAGCSPGFARMMEQSKEISRFFAEVKEAQMAEQQQEKEQEKCGPAPDPRREYLAYYVARHASFGIKSGAGRLLAHSEYEAQGMLRRVVTKTYAVSDGWAVIVSATARDELALVADPETASVTPGRVADPHPKQEGGRRWRSSLR